MIRNFSNLFNDFFNSEKAGGLILVGCTVISLLITNSALGPGYLHFFHQSLDLSFAGVALDYSIEHWVNDGLMAIFFLLVGLEVERELYVGEISEFRKAILPLAGALGGILVPSLIHYALNSGTPTESGFAIPMATDIAFALGVLSLAGNRVPVAAKVFLTALAIIDDIGAVLVIAFFYTDTIYWNYLLAALAILTMLFIFNRAKVRYLALYLLPGIALWFCFLKSGIHATLAGVLLAFVIPFHNKDDQNISYRLQHFLHKPVAFIIIPIFALVNTAIVIPSDAFSILTQSNSVGIMLGLFLGKVIGIFSIPFLLVKFKWARLQEGLKWKNMVALGFLGGIGFTMSMFISNLAFQDAVLISSSKLAILIASFFSAIVGLTLFYSGRQSRPRKTAK